MRKSLLSLFVIVFFVLYSSKLYSQQCVTCNNSTADGENASVIGPNNHANAMNSVVIGKNSIADAWHSIVIGNYSNTLNTGVNSITIGRYASVASGMSMVIGYGYNSSNLLMNNMQQSLMMGFNSDRPTLFISMSDGPGSTGKIAIGNVVDQDGQMAPQAKLHLRSDDDEAATLFLEPSNWTTEYNAEIWLGDTSHSISAELNKGLVFHTGNRFIFNNGFVGLATDEPSALLDVNGTARIRSLSGNGDRLIVADSLGNLTTGDYFQPCTSCENTQNTGMNSSAIGTNTVSTGNSSFASGFGSETTANYTTAMGFFAKATYTKGIALGSAVKATMDKSIVIGSGEWNADIYLENNIPRSLMVGFRSRYPTLFVSESPQSGYYNKTGRIGIGNMTDPQAKLHIYSDDDEAATLFLQPSNWTTEYNAEIMLGDTAHSISAEIDEGLVYKTEENHVFTGGNIYLEDIDKGIIMKSPDGRCWLGKLDNNGALNFELMESCPGEASAIFEKNQSNEKLKVYPNPTHDYLTVEMENSGHELLTVSLLDENGRELRVSKTTAGKTMLYTGDLTKGAYLVVVTGNGMQLSAKVIK
jgi:hypothetical protein